MAEMPEVLFGVRVQYPLYLFTPDAAGWQIRKLHPNGYEQRYAVTGVEPVARCSCLGWMKTGDCKHLKTLRGDWTWVKPKGGDVPGVPSHYAAAAVARALHPEDTEEQLDAKAEAMAGMLPPVCGGVEAKSPAVSESPDRMMWVHEFSDGLRLGILVLFPR